MSLKKFIAETNATNKLFGQAEVATPVNVAECNALLDSIEGHLSPENLHADGERPAAQVKARFKMLTAAQTTLNNMKAKFEKAEAEPAKAPAEQAQTPVEGKKVSTAARVREHIQNTYDSAQAATEAMSELVDQAMAFGIKTKSAARQCVTANIPKVFS